MHYNYFSFILMRTHKKEISLTKNNIKLLYRGCTLFKDTHIRGLYFLDSNFFSFLFRTSTEEHEIFLEMKRYAMISIISAKNTDLEISIFLSCARSIPHKVHREFEASAGCCIKHKPCQNTKLLHKTQTIAKHKTHEEHPDITRSTQFVQSKRSRTKSAQ